MNPARRTHLLLPALGLALLAARGAAAQTYRVGDRVVCIADAELTVGSTAVDDVWPGLDLTVTDVNGKWPCVSNGHPGWLDQRHVIPLGRAAIDRLTRMLQANPSARLYSGRALVWRALGELDIAIADYNEAIRLDPSTAAYYNNRGRTWGDKGDHDRAITDYGESLRLESDAGNKAITYNNRGRAWKAIGEYDQAIADYNECLRLDPKYALAYHNRGNAWSAKGEYDRAISDYDECLRLDPKYSDVLNSFAWLLATCPDDGVRNGERAVSLATTACELTNWKHSPSIGTLSAAVAETGDYIQALEHLDRAENLAPNIFRDIRSGMRVAFDSGKPYRLAN
jgi:tetratricopeptide (TPR) repeat protein